VQEKKLVGQILPTRNVGAIPEPVQDGIEGKVLPDDERRYSALLSMIINSL
jgi:hypothetical protein